jgi:hypothetical protein
MNSSQFKLDHKNQELITSMISAHFRRQNNVFEDIVKSSESEDKAGSDFKLRSAQIFRDDYYHHIDYKSATNHRKIRGENSIASFAFEIQYQKDGKNLEGWLFGDKYYLTEYYLLSWVWVFDKSKIPKNVSLKESDISDIEVLIVKKEDIINYLKKYDVLKESYKEVIQWFNTSVEEYKNGSKKFAIKENIKENEIVSRELSIDTPNSYKIRTDKFCVVKMPKIYHSIKYSEQPYNIIIEKDVLKQLAKFHTIISYNR